MRTYHIVFCGLLAAPLFAQTVTLTATFSPSGGPGEKSISSKGDLKIMKVMPVFTCFFYMH